jgi:hypothetical protein
MAFSFAYDSANRVLLAKFEGRITDETILEFYDLAKRLIASAPRLRGTIVDFSPVAEFAVRPETIREVAWSPPIDPEASRPFVAVAPTAQVFDVMWILPTEGHETRPNFHLVKSMEHAYAIVGITSAKFETLSPAELSQH